MLKVVGISTSLLKTKVAPIMRLDDGYIKSISEAGALPLMLPVYEDLENAERIVDELDAIILAGGVDISPFYYNEDPVMVTTYQPERDASEMMLLKAALKRRIPILAVCRGLQLTNIALGGSLHQDLKMSGYEEIVHHRDTIKPDGPDEVYHFIKISKDSKFYSIVENEEMVINSIHHQAIKELGNGLKPVAWSRDGIIEVVEMEDYPYYYGFQFHPERLSEDAVYGNEFKKLFKDFIRSIDL